MLRADSQGSKQQPRMPMPDTIVLIHGLWMTPLSWAHWVEHYTEYALDWATRNAAEPRRRPAMQPAGG